tara:strand:- start:1771 stop:2058 length:288 start_codon:yes stop_codon:yes gene_type:complete
VFQTIQYLAQVDKLYEVRLLHIPGKSDLDTEVMMVGHYLQALPESVNIRLNAFQHHGVVGEAQEWEKCSKDEMGRFHARLSQFVSRPMNMPSVYV